MKLVESVMTEMEAPFERLIDRHVQPPPTLIICDAFLYWAIDVGNRRNIPVAAFWTTSTSELWVQFFHIFLQGKHLGEDTTISFFFGRLVTTIFLANSNK
jgi:hypothetical protein